jgi:hypothetical protein
MSTNGNGRWFQSYWTKKGGYIIPRQPGWYAARPECCDMTVKIFLYENLLDVYVEGNDNKYDVYDFKWWYPLKTQKDKLPEFRE